MGEIDRWNLVTFSEESLSMCLEEKLRCKIKYTSLRRAIINYHTIRFQGETVSDHVIEKESQTDEYFNDETNKNLHLSLSSSNSVKIYEIRQALLKCSDPITTDLNTRHSLPRFIQEETVGLLLDYMLVKRRELSEIISSKPDLKLLMSFARHSLRNYEQACKTIISTSLNEMLRFYWNHRAELFFDARERDSYISHDYTSHLPVPHTYDNPKLLYERRFHNFSDRNQLVPNSNSMT